MSENSATRKAALWIGVVFLLGAALGGLTGYAFARHAVSAANAPLPVEFLTALSLAGDASCLEAIAGAHARARDAWWRGHLADAFRTIAAREKLTRRHAVMKRISKRWGMSIA